jgi:AcrR family transcriptional regulator
VNPVSLANSEPATIDRREEVLAAAALCFMRKGYESTSMDDVADALGATKGRVYHHFRSKPDLFFAVYRRAMDINMSVVEPHAHGRGAASERLTRMAQAHALAMMETQTFQRSLTLGADLYRFGATNPADQAILEELMDLRHVYEDLFRRTVEDGLRDGSISVPDASLAVKALFGALNWVAVWYSPRKDESRSHREKLAQTLVETVMGGYRRV